MPKKTPALQYKTIDLPVLPLRDVVVFPHMVIPLFVGRVRSVAALEAAVSGSQRVLLVAQKDAAQDSPAPDDIYRVGTVAAILQMLKMPDGTVKVLVEGKRRATIARFIHDPDDADGSFACEAELVEDAPPASREADGLVRAVAGEFERYGRFKRNSATWRMCRTRPTNWRAKSPTPACPRKRATKPRTN